MRSQHAARVWARRALWLKTCSLSPRVLRQAVRCQLEQLATSDALAQRARRLSKRRDAITNATKPELFGIKLRKLRKLRGSDPIETRFRGVAKDRRRIPPCKTSHGFYPILNSSQALITTQRARLTRTPEREQTRRIAKGNSSVKRNQSAALRAPNSAAAKRHELTRGAHP